MRRASATPTRPPDERRSGLFEVVVADVALLGMAALRTDQIAQALVGALHQLLRHAVADVGVVAVEAPARSVLRLQHVPHPLGVVGRPAVPALRVVQVDVAGLAVDGSGPRPSNSGVPLSGALRPA